MAKTSGLIDLKWRDIDLDDTRFKTSSTFSIDRLAASVQRIGLLHPPVVTKRGQKWILVTGWKRAAAWRKIGMRTLPAAVLDEPNDREAFLYAVHENLAVREFAYLEKAEILTKLGGLGMSDPEIIKTIMPMIDIPPTKLYLDGYRAIGRFPPGVKRLILDRKLPFSVTQLLAGFGRSDLEAIVPLLLPLGQNKQKEILEDLRGLCLGKNRSVRGILRREDIRRILRSDAWPVLQKSERIRRILKKMRNPHLADWEEDFAAVLKKMSWPKNIAIAPAPYFECDEMTVNFRFRDAKEFKEHAARLAGLAAKEELNDLWKHERKSKKAGS
jgi:hypothetical protein